jgi:hypothetical protein
MKSKIQYLIIATLLIFISGCFPKITTDVISRELISSKGEKIYINSINWGITGDYQLSSITKNKNKHSKGIDTIDAVRGLEPFIYSFNHDTLRLYFNQVIRYVPKEKFETVAVEVINCGAYEYYDLKEKAYDNNGYYNVPMREKVIYPDDMPMPPERK